MFVRRIYSNRCYSSFQLFSPVFYTCHSPTLLSLVHLYLLFILFRLFTRPFAPPPLVHNSFSYSLAPSVTCAPTRPLDHSSTSSFTFSLSLSVFFSFSFLSYNVLSHEAARNPLAHLPGRSRSSFVSRSAVGGLSQIHRRSFRKWLVQRPPAHHRSPVNTDTRALFRCRAVRGHVRARAFTSNVPYLYKGEPTLCVYLCRRACKPTDQPGYRSRTRRIMRRARWLKRAANLSPE